MAMNRKPTSPGEILKVVNRIINGKTSVTAEMALTLGAAFDMSPDSWLNAQKAVDLYKASQRTRRLPGSILKRAS